MKGVYLSTLAVTALVDLILIYVFIAMTLGLDSELGNGGGFLAAALISLGSLFTILAASFGTFALSLALLFEHRLPTSKFYHWRIPLSLSAPSYLVMFLIWLRFLSTST